MKKLKYVNIKEVFEITSLYKTKHNNNIFLPFEEKAIPTPKSTLYETSKHLDRRLKGQGRGYAHFNESYRDYE